MSGKLTTIDHRLLVRRCVQCGYDGVPLADDLEFDASPQACPRCDCDLLNRPPRSYAEMEGLLGHPLSLRAALPASRSFNEERLIHRWLAVLFCAMMFVVLIVCLSAAAVP